MTVETQAPVIFRWRVAIVVFYDAIDAVPVGWTVTPVKGASYLMVRSYYEIENS